MSKQGLSLDWQYRILGAMQTAAAQYHPMTAYEVALNCGYPRPERSSIRVTLWWLVQHGMVRRAGRGQYRLS